MNLDCRYPHSKRSGKRRLGQSQAGQIVIEYVLLLTIAVSAAILLTKLLIGRTEGEEGFIIQAWNQLVIQIGSDKADDVSPAE